MQGPDQDVVVFYQSAVPFVEQVDDPLRFQTREIRDAQDSRPESDLAHLAPSRYNRPTQGEVTSS